MRRDEVRNSCFQMQMPFSLSDDSLLYVVPSSKHWSRLNLLNTKLQSFLKLISASLALYLLLFCCFCIFAVFSSKIVRVQSDDVFYRSTTKNLWSKNGRKLMRFFFSCAHSNPRANVHYFISGQVETFPNSFTASFLHLTHVLNSTRVCIKESWVTIQWPLWRNDQEPNTYSTVYLPIL